MNSHQRTEITNVDALQEDETLGVDHKSHVSIHDYLPAMKAICDKLEEASGKVDCSLPFVCVLHCYLLFSVF